MPLDRPKTAPLVLLVIDMQNAFCDPAGSMVRLGRSLEGLDEAITQTATAIDLGRMQDVPVRLYQTRLLPRLPRCGGSTSAGWPRASRALGACSGELGMPKSSPRCNLGDVVIDKTRFDAFLDTPLLGIFRDLGTEEVVVTGVLTNICVETTIRGTVMRDFGATVLADCCAGVSKRLHDISLEVMDAHQLASVRTLAGGYSFSPQALVNAAVGR